MRRRGIAVACLALLIAAIAFAATDTGALVKRIVLQLEKTPGYDAVYKATAASGREIDIHVRYSGPDKLRIDIDTLGAVTAYDGKRYVYYDKERAKAVVLDANEALQNLSQLYRAMSAIKWAYTGAVAPQINNKIYPNLNLDLDFERLDISLEIATKPYRHSWVRELASRRDARIDGSYAVMQQGSMETTVRKKINLETGMLQSIELGTPGDPVGTLALQSYQVKKIADIDFAFAIPENTQIRSQRDDPSLMQQLLITSFRGNLDQVLTAAVQKWPNLLPADKQLLRQAIQKVFDQVFRLAEKDTLAHIAKTMQQPAFVKQIQDAFNNAQAKDKFRRDNPELSGAELENAWREQVNTETQVALLGEILRTVDSEVVEPIRAQALERTVGLADAQRKEVVQSATEPIHLAFREMVMPTIVEELKKILR